MNLEHVSVEDSHVPHPRQPAQVNQSTTFPPQDTEASCQLRAKKANIDHILTKLSDKGLSGKEHVKAYLHDMYRRNCRPNTIRTNSSSIILFLSFLKHLGKARLETVSREDISAFVEHEQDRGLAPTSVHGRLRGVYAFLYFLIQRDVIHPDVLKRKLRIKLPDTLPRAIDPEDIKQLLSVLKKPRDRALILILLRTGMRIGELLGTKVQDFNLKEQCIEIFEAQKNRVGRVVYLSKDAQAALKRWLKLKNPQTVYLFYGYRGQPLCYGAARSIFKKYLDKAQLSHKPYTLHCLRHTFASEMLNAGMSLQSLQDLLGHSCIEMTRRYARLTDNTRREEYYKAMQIIERGGINGHYQLDYQLPKIP
jgi:site-specific recombinase XerD